MLVYFNHTAIMSESEQCSSDHPTPPPSTSGTVCYMQRNCVPQENINIQPGMFRMPPSVKPCMIPQNFGMSENSSSCTQIYARNVSEGGNQSQGHPVHAHNDVAIASLNYQGSEISVKRNNVQSISVFPSTSFGVKRKHTQVSNRNVFDNSKNCKCSHDDSYTTGYTSDDSEEDSLHSKRYKSRMHQNVGLMKTSPYSFSKSEIVPSAGRPLLRDKSLNDSQTLTKQCPTYFKHLKKDPDFGCSSKYEIEPIWEERKYQLAIREQKICEAEEALKQEEEKAQECLQLALQQQELALNEREEALRLREAAVQKKFEQATRLLEESRKVVDSSKFRLGKGAIGFIGPIADQTTKLSYPVQFGNDSLELLSTNFHVSSSVDNSNRDQIHIENKDNFLGLGVDRSGSFSEKVSGVEKNFNLTTSSSNFPRNTFQSNIQGLIHVPEKYDNKSSIDPGKVVRTYTRGNKFRTVSEKPGSSVLCKTDVAIPPRAHSVTPLTKTSVRRSNSLCRVDAACNEETVINGGASVTITPTTADDRPPRSFSATPKLELSFGYEDDNNEESAMHVGQMFPPVEGNTELEPKCMSMCDNQAKDRPISDQFKVLPPKFVNTKPVPPVDKYDSQRLLKSEPKSETSLYCYDTICIDGGAESDGNTSSNSISMKGGLYPGTRKFNGSCGKMKGNLSMKTLAVVSIPGCENRNDDIRDHSEVKPKPHMHGCYKSADSCKTKGISTTFSNVNDISVVQTRNFVCGTKDTSKTVGETLSYEQNVNTSDNFGNQESTVSAVGKRQLQCDVPCHIPEKNPQSLSGAHNTQQWHGRRLLPGDILYTPVNKLNSQVGPPLLKDVSVSKGYFHIEQDSKQGFSSSVETPEFKHMSVMPRLSLQYSKEMTLSNIRLNQSLNSDVTRLTDPTSRTGRDTPVLLTSTPKSFSISSVQGRALTYVSSVPVKHITPSPINSVPLPSSQLVDTTTVRNSLQGPFMTSQQNVISTTSSSIRSSPSNHNVIYSNSPLLSNSVQSCSSAKDFKEAQQKSLLETSGHPNFVNETPSSQKLPKVLTVSSTDTQVLPVVQGTVEQTGCSNNQFGHVSLQVGNISQVRLSQPLYFQESKSPCNTQWLPSNFNTPVSEVLTNLGDYDPISQTLTTSNPIFLQSILENNVSAGLASNSLVNSVTNSPDRIGQVSAGQNTVQLQTEDVCGNSEEVTPIHNSDFTKEILDKKHAIRRGSNDKDNDGKNLKKEDPICTRITLTDSNEIQSPVCHSIKNASYSSDIDSVPQTHSDVEGVTVKYSPIKLNDITSDTSRNFSDSESDFSRTGDRFFISTGILGTHELTKTATSLHGGYIGAESNLNENCYSDSDDGCKVEEIGMDVCSPVGQDELEESNSRLMDNRVVKALSECEGTDVEVTGNTESVSVNLFDASDGEVADDCEQARLVENNVGLSESEAPVDDISESEAPVDDRVQNSSYSTSNTSRVHHMVEMEKGVENLENMGIAQSNEELMSFNSFSLDENQDTITSNLNEESQLIFEKNKLKNSRVSKRGRGRRRRGSSLGRGRNRGKCVSNMNIKSKMLCYSGEDKLSDVKYVTGEKIIDENETKSGISVISDSNKEPKVYTPCKEDTDSDAKKAEEELEPEMFEHVSHSGRKLKLRSHLVKAVSKCNLRKRANSTSQSKPDEPLVAKTNKNKRGRGGRTIKKPECTEGNKVMCEKDSESIKEGCKSNISKVSVTNVKIKCGKCDYVSESKARFNSHAYHEHNGLARPFGENQEFSEEEWNIILSSTMKSVKKLKCEICAKIFRSLGGYKNHVKFCGHSVEEVLTTCTSCLKPVQKHNLQVHMRKFHNQMIRKKAEVPPPIEQDPEEPRPRRKAATSCNAKLKVWRSSNPPELNGSDQSEDEDKECERLGIDKFCEKEKIMVPKEIRIKWKEHIKLNGKANCLNSNCSYNFKNIKNGRRHYAKCPFSSIPREYKCKICGYTCESEAQFRVHISNKHKELVELDLESDYELSDDETRNLNPRYASRTRVVGKHSADQLRPFEPAFNWTLEFMIENYSEELFADLTASADDWVLLDDKELRKYVPIVDVSPKFKVSVVSKLDNGNKCTNWQVLDRLSGASIYEGYMLFSGGPTSASAWCPLPLKDSLTENSQYLALSAASLPDRRYSLVQSYSHEGVIQIWQCPLNIENECSVPQFQLGIAHNYGSIWSLVWCPSGIYNLLKSDEFNNMSNFQKLGLLAAACSDGSIRVFVIPNPAQLEFHGASKIFRTRPKLTLKPSSLSNGNAQCLKVDWFRGKGHGYIAGAYSTGYVCIWDVRTSSPLLRATDADGDVLYPINTFLAHNGVCSTVSFCPTTNGRNLLSGGNDRTYKFWDLENTNMPLSIVRKGLVTDSCWISHWGGCFIAFDDVYGLSNTNTCFKENGFYGIHSRNVLSSNSPVWTISGSEWMNTLVQGDSAGEVVITLQQQLFKNYENEKVPSKRKVPLLAVKLENLGSGTSVLLSEKNRVKFPKKNKKGSVSSQSENSSEEDGLSAAVYLDLPRTYSETCDGYGVVFAEQDYHNFSNIPEAELLECKRSERMEPGPLGCYPLMSATSVSWNNNFLSNSWVFIGTQSGLCRLVSIEAMKDGRTNLAGVIREKIENLNSGKVDG